MIDADSDGKCWHCRARHVDVLQLGDPNDEEYYVVCFGCLRLAMAFWEEAKAEQEFTEMTIAEGQRRLAELGIQDQPIPSFRERVALWRRGRGL